MAVPTVWSVRELRARISSAVDSAATGHAVFIGAYRRPEIVLISVQRYRELTAHERRPDPLDNTDQASVFAPAPPEEVLAARRLARGEIIYPEYARIMRALLEIGELGADLPAPGPPDAGRGWG